jgi:hypothetical protein
VDKLRRYLSFTSILVWLGVAVYGSALVAATAREWIRGDSTYFCSYGSQCWGNVGARRCCGLSLAQDDLETPVTRCLASCD